MGKVYSCDLCNYEAKGKTKLRSHQRVVYKGKRFNCDECDFQYTSTGNLKAHKVVKHSNLLLSFKCEKWNFKAVTVQLVEKYVNVSSSE